jgi:Endonuclease NucS
MHREHIEDTIRDYLAEDLSIISSELTLLGKEYYLPHTAGTRGFIDLFAKDNRNRYVIIELKRSKEASRETLHEILKYVEALKENKTVNESEFRVIVVSTEWKELLVPFSSFIKRVCFTVEGFLLNVDDQLHPISCERITPLDLQYGRFFSPIHSIRLYSSVDNLNRGIQSHIEVFEDKQIRDYVLVIMYASEIFYKKTLSCLESFGEAFELSINMDDGIIPHCPYMIYSTLIRISENRYLDLIGRDKETYEELIEEIELNDLKGENIITLYEDYLIHNIHPFPFSEIVEISYPAKFAFKLIEDEGWAVNKILRFGALEHNQLLDDSVIIDELSGSQGSDGRMFRCNFTSDDMTKIEEVKASAKRLLSDNQAWLNHINYIIQCYVDGSENFSADIDICLPRSILLSIYRQLKEEGTTTWVPTYRLHFDFGDRGIKKLYVGVIEWNGKKVDMSKVIDKYYSGDISKLALTAIWDGSGDDDLEIMRDLGLKFRTLLYELHPPENEIAVFKFEDFEFVPTEDFDSLNSSFMLFIEEHIEFFRAFVRDMDSCFVT